MVQVAFVMLALGAQAPDGRAPLASCADLVKLLEAAQPQFVDDLTFEYEGKVILPRPAERLAHGIAADGVKEIFSGVYRWRRDGESCAELFLDSKAKRGTLTHYFLTNRNDKSVIYRKRVDSEQARTIVGGPKPALLNRPMAPEHFLLLNLFRSYRDRGFRMEDEGTAEVRGAVCQKVSFVLRAPHDPPVGTPAAARFWIDFSRGGFVLRGDWARGSELLSRLEVLTVERLDQPNGQSFWLPTAARVETFLGLDAERRPVATEEPVSMVYYTVLGPTVVVNSHFADRSLEPPHRPADVISDQLRKLQYRFGSYRPPRRAAPSRAERERALRQLLREAEAQGNVLKAGSWERRSGQSWALWVPWSVTAAALGCLLLLLLRARKGA